MPSETENKRKALKEELDHIERELTGTISIRVAAQFTNHMCDATFAKKPVSSLDIRYSVFFLWEAKKSLQQKLSIPVSSYCQLVNGSIIDSRKIVQCERLETRLKKESSRIMAKYRTLKGQHRSLFKTKSINMLIFKGEITESPAARLQISGTKSYDDLCDRQKQRRRKEVAKHLQEYLGGLKQTGLIPRSIEMETTNHQSIIIPLTDSSNVSGSSSGSGSSSSSSSSSSSPSTDSDDKPCESVLYLLMKYNISMQFYHELSMLFEELPRSHKLKQLKKDTVTLPVYRTPGEYEGAQYNFIDLLKEKVIVKTTEDPSLFANNNLQVKISMDGAKYGRASNFCILSFTFLEIRGLSSSNVHTVAAVKCVENHEAISESFKDVFDSINELIKEPTLAVGDTVYDVEIFLCCDYKMTLLLMGLKEATATHSCVWCTVSKDQRWDVDVSDKQYLITQRRTLQSFYDNYNDNNNKGCKHLPLLNIDPDHIIPDELHLLLRITDVLTSNLISAAKTDDQKHKRNCKLLEGPMINRLIKNIRSCGVNFNIWEKDGKFEYTSLMGDDKKKLLKHLPLKLIDCQPTSFASDVKRLWEDFGDTYFFITSKNPAIEYHVLHNKAKEWIKSFWTLGHVCAGYKPHNVTPYMHIMTYHVPNFIRQYGSIKQFSCQGVEKKNDDCKRVFFRSSNKRDATSDILIHEEKVEHFSGHKRKSRPYKRKRREHHKENNPRAKRQRKDTA